LALLTKGDLISSKLALSGEKQTNRAVVRPLYNASDVVDRSVDGYTDHGDRGDSSPDEDGDCDNEQSPPSLCVFLVVNVLPYDLQEHDGKYTSNDERHHEELEVASKAGEEDSEEAGNDEGKENTKYNVESNLLVLFQHEA